MARRYKPKRYSAALGNFNRTIRSTAGSGRALVLATQYQQLDSEKTAEALKRAAKTARASIKEIADKGQSSLTFEEIQDRLSDLDAEQQRLNIWFASAQAANESAELQAAIIEYSSIISELRVQLESIIMEGRASKSSLHRAIGQHLKRSVKRQYYSFRNEFIGRGSDSLREDSLKGSAYRWVASRRNPGALTRAFRWSVGLNTGTLEDFGARINRKVSRASRNIFTGDTDGISIDTTKEEARKERRERRRNAITAERLIETDIKAQQKIGKETNEKLDTLIKETRKNKGSGGGGLSNAGLPDMGRGRKGDIRKLLKAGGSASIALAPLALWLAADSLSDKSNKRADGTRQNFFGDQGTDVIDSRAFSYGASIGSGALIGAKIGSFIMPGLGTAAGGAIGASAGGLAALFADYEDDLVDKERKYQYEIMTNRYGSAAAGIALSQNNIPDDVRMEASRRANLETDSMFAATSTFGGAAPVINIMQRISRDIATNSTTIEKTFNPNNMSSWMTAAMAEGMNKSNISDILGLSALPFSGITSGIVGAASLGIGSGGGGRSTYSTSPRADTLSSPNAGAARTVTKTHKRYPTNTYTRKGNDGQLHAYVIDPTAPNGERDLGKFDYRRMYADVTEQIPVTENAAVAGAFKPYTGEGSGGAVTPAGYSGVYGQLLNNLAYSEGTANQANSGYDTEYAYKEYSPGSDIPISQMTLAQLDEYQTGMLNNQAAKGIGAKKRSSAAGRYQYIKTTLNSLKHKYHNDPAARARMAEYGIDFEDDTVFSPEFQDRLAAYTIGEERGGRKFLEGKMSLPQFMNQISKEWASALNAYGRGSYNQGTKGSYSFWHNTYADMQQNYQGGSGVSSSDFITAPADTSSDFLIGLHSGTPKAPSILMAPTETADSDFLTPSVKQVSPRVNPTMSNAEYAAQVEDMKKKPKGAWSALQRRIYSRMQTTPQAGVTNKPNDFSSQLDNMFASTIYNAFDNSPFDTSILRSAGLFSHPLPFNIPDIPSSFESAVNNIPEMDRINDGVSKAKSVINKARDMSPIHKMPNIGISLDELTFDAALGSLLNWDLMGD